MIPSQAIQPEITNQVSTIAGTPVQMYSNLLLRIEECFIILIISVFIGKPKQKHICDHKWLTCNPTSSSKTACQLTDRVRKPLADRKHRSWQMSTTPQARRIAP